MAMRKTDKNNNRHGFITGGFRVKIMLHHVHSKDETAWDLNLGISQLYKERKDNYKDLVPLKTQSSVV